MTDITHEALMGRKFERYLAVWRLKSEQPGVYTTIQVRLNEKISVLLLEDLDMVTVPNCRTLTDLDNLIKLFV